MGLPGIARANATLSAIFSDGMVLQREMPIPIWGRATPGEKIEVNLGPAHASVTAAPSGKWSAELPAQPAGGPFTLEIKADNQLAVQNVLIGEVWLASGQSNMQFPVEKAKNAADEIAAAHFPEIREFTAKAVVAAEPQENVPGRWQAAEGPATAKLSAVAYFFARELHQNLNVPVGIVHASMGWTPGEAWMSRQALQSDPDLKRDILDRWDAWAAQYPQASKDYEAALKTWEDAKKTAEAAGQPLPSKPRRPVDPNFFHRATGLWNGSIAPLIPYAIRGVIWYQGETNDQRGYQYRKLFPALIADWRRQWAKPELPFLWVQLSSVLPPDPAPAESEWSEVREAQAMALSLPHTGMAVTLDIGNEKDVHPTDKQDVGHRLALNALASVYGQKIEYSGPILRQSKIEGSKIRLTFTNVNHGLATPDGSPLKGFAIAGDDRHFVTASAQIDGDSILVWSDQVAKPVSVRYAWANNPMPNSNLFSRTKSGELLPAGPFRTDDWPGKSFGVVKMPVDDMG